MNHEIQHVPSEIERQPRSFSFADLKAMAEEVEKSGMFKMSAPQVMTLFMIAEAKRIHPMEALERYHVYNGRPSMRSDAMLAEFQRSGGRIEWVTDTEAKCEAVFYHRDYCPKGHPISFTMDDAKRAKLAGKEVWQAHPRAMLRARVITTGIRMINPSVILGIYTPDEIEEFTPPAPIEVTAKASMPHQMAERLPLRQRHEPVAKTVEAIKEREEPLPPKSDCRLWIENTLADFNPGYMKATGEKAITSYQIANAVLSAAIEDGKTEESELLNNRMKRDTRLAAKEINRLWDADSLFVMRAVGSYLADKLPQIAEASVDEAMDRIASETSKAG